MSENERESYALQIPYPIPEISCQNLYWGKLLQEDYAGSNSEFTAINQYIYGNIVLEDKSAQVAKALRGIAIVEMQHLKMLGDTVKKLGVDPRFRSSNQRNSLKYWSAGNVNYVCSVSGILLENIRGEYAAIEQYKKHIALINDEEIRNFLRRIIADEDMHIKILSDLYNKYIQK